jgi:cellulose synthase/poly-beta-1,6-N-acetylglucosamine synthase-like glycosyltransferase
MAKAFESLFGSVTCLPGCFTLYRLRTPDTHKPLLISNQMITDYSENRVDTLHMKNLLHLGEDRYLTTLLLKHFPLFKTQFVRDAHAFTVAPDDWKVLLSQRRRWINSTIHNLGELVFLEQLCGFCCFSMRFIVMIDLLSTLVQPVTVAYVSSFVNLQRLLIYFHHPVDYISTVSRHRTTQIYPYAVINHDSGRLWCASSGLYHETEVGYDWLDDLLHPCNPGILFLPATLLVLENG